MCGDLIMTNEDLIVRLNVLASVNSSWTVPIVQIHLSYSQTELVRCCLGESRRWMNLLYCPDPIAEIFYLQQFELGRRLGSSEGQHPWDWDWDWETIVV